MQKDYDQIGEILNNSTDVTDIVFKREGIYPNIFLKQIPKSEEGLPAITYIMGAATVSFGVTDRTCTINCYGETDQAALDLAFEVTKLFDHGSGNTIQTYSNMLQSVRTEENCFLAPVEVRIQYMRS